ncbi:hypothetical protein DY000_02058567 [Brassica cretica]|uniref:Uncharacterized protein n=1 Tax=Brassica cretica TaxID=69181 RepID=A0ABQ7ASN1_BRACR|nr:hypothetical protein DY000_02058567 [Brassica cretica]
MPIVSDVTLGNNKRKRDQGLSGDEEKSDGLAVPEVDDEMFWKYAPLSVVTAEYERRMGAERDPLDLISEGEESDHIILEMEERRGAGSVYDYFPSLNKGNLFVEDQNVQMVGSVDEVPSLKRPRQEDDCVDKYQVGKKIVSAEFYALQKICDDYDQEEELLQDASDPVDRGAVGPDLLKQMDSDALLDVSEDNPLALISEDEDADHIILEMEDRREVRLVSDSLNSLIVVDQDVQMWERRL